MSLLVIAWELYRRCRNGPAPGRVYRSNEERRADRQVRRRFLPARRRDRHDCASRAGVADHRRGSGDSGRRILLGTTPAGSTEAPCGSVEAPRHWFRRRELVSEPSRIPPAIWINGCTNRVTQERNHLPGAGFRDRREAGQQLAARLAPFARRDDIVVLALPRGGVPVAFEVARALQAPLDLFLVRKLGAPGHPELAIGALASGGVRVLNHDVLAELQIPRAAI